MSGKHYLFLATHIFVIRKILWFFTVVGWFVVFVLAFVPGWHWYVLTLAAMILISMALIYTKPIALRQDAIRDARRQEWENWENRG